VKKNIFLFLLFCFFSSGSLFAERTSAYYLQYNALFNVSSKFNVDITSVTEEEGVKKTNNIKYELTSEMMQPFYNSNFIVGYHNNGNWAFEFEVASYEFYFKKKDSDAVVQSDIDFASTKINYQMANIKYDLFSIWGFTPFLKIGAGAGFFDVWPRNTGRQGSRLEFAYQGGVGVYYSFNRYLDFEVAYKYLSNLSKKRENYSTSVDQSYIYTESMILVALRLNI
jgi:hypothetical protein